MTCFLEADFYLMMNKKKEKKLMRAFTSEYEPIRISIDREFILLLFFLYQK